MSKIVKSMEWIRVANEYMRDENARTCPACGTEKGLDVHITHYGRTSYTFVCKKCGASAHIDGKQEG